MIMENWIADVKRSRERRAKILSAGCAAIEALCYAEKAIADFDHDPQIWAHLSIARDQLAKAIERIAGQIEFDEAEGRR